MVNQENEELTSIGMGIDQHAVLFKTSDKIIRAIKPEYAEFYNDVLENNSIQALMSSNVLIQTKRSTIKIEGYPLVLEHPLLSVVSFPFEWTPNMFKDAAVTILKLNIELLKVGYCTHDAHPWNVLFDGTTPKFIDFTSIIKALPGNKWRAANQFRDYCLNPLQMMEAGYPTTTRQLMREILTYPDPAFVKKFLGNSSVKKAHSVNLGKTVLNFSKGCAKKLPLKLQGNIKEWISTTRQAIPEWVKTQEGSLVDTQTLLNKTEALHLTPPIAQWSEYYSGKNELPVYNGQMNVLNSIRESTPKHTLVSDLLKKINPVSVLDMGCNRGLYSQMAALQGAIVVGVDLDERALDDMYLDSKRLKSNAVPLYINAVAPAEAIGFTELPFPSVVERLRSELVMCLALVHHLVFKSTNMSFEHISKLFDSYSSKFLLVEFIPKEDVHIQSWPSENFDWYNLENFKTALSKHFNKIEIFDSFPSPRILLFCEKAC